MSPGTSTRSVLSRHLGVRRTNTAVALSFLAVMLVAAGLGVCILMFWSGWVVAAFAVPLVPTAWFWFRGLRMAPVAREVEDAFPTVRGRLLAALQLSEYRDGAREAYSTELVRAAVEDVERRVRPLRLSRLVCRRRTLAAGLAALAVLGLTAGYFIHAPRRARAGLYNAFAPGLLDVEFEVSPGDTAVLPGREVVLACRVSPPGLFGAVLLETSDARFPRRSIPLDGDSATITLQPESGFGYRFRLLSRASRDYRVQVREPLELEQLSFTYRYPSYTGLAEYRSGSTDIVALPGTEVLVEAIASQPFERARLVLGPDTTALVGGIERGLRGVFVVAGDGEGWIELNPASGGEVEQVCRVRIRTVPDEPPLIRVLAPGRDVDLPASMQLVLGVHTLDDFGLGGLYLDVSRDSSHRRLMVKRLDGVREDTTLYVWDLSQSGLLPGDVLSYRLAVADNDEVSGPKTSRSRAFRVRFPTMTEIYDAAMHQTEYTAEELAPMMETQEELDSELERIGDEMRRSGDLSWDERRALEQVLSEQADLAQDISELRQEVREFIDELSRGLTLDQETVDRLAQLHQILNDLLPRELQESLARLQQNLDQESGELRQALEQFEVDQEQLRAGIEQALEMLERVMEEQKLDELARRAEEFAEAEAEIEMRLSSEPAERLAELQDQLGAGLDSLLGEMDELASSMSDSATAESLAMLGRGAEQDSLVPAAHSAAGRMREGRDQDARSQAGKLAEKLGSLADALDGLSVGLKRKRSAETTEELLQAAEELLMVSREQEDLESFLAGAPTDELAGRQMALSNGTAIVAESLAVLAGRTMSVGSDLVRELARAMASMNVAARALVDGNAAAARQNMATARAGLNRTVALILLLAKNESRGGGMSGGMADMMQQLSQMTAEQMAMNATMNGIPIPMPGGFSSAQLQALDRILSRQRAVRQQLQEMLESAGGDTPGLTSSLEGLLEEMMAVEQDLSELNITRDLVERQESILSHLLDAQRSVRQQGYREQRESEGARPFEARPSPQLPEDRGERDRILREELMRALKDRGLGEYELMVRGYFERLLGQPETTR